MKKGDGLGESTEGFGISKDESIRLIVRTCLKNEVTDVKQIAYVLATANHETNGFIAPEESYGRSQAKSLGYKGGENYYGRGYVHLTHKDNYENFDKLLGMKGQLVKNPNKAFEPEVAAKILVIGMRDGEFTGVGLDKYIDSKHQDYIGARKIVNGTDDAKKIATDAKNWEAKVPKIIDEIKTVDALIDTTKKVMDAVTKEIFKKTSSVSDEVVDRKNSLASSQITEPVASAADLLDPKGREKYEQSLTQAKRLDLQPSEIENLAMAITCKSTANGTIKQIDDMVVTRGNAIDGGDRVHFMFKPNGDRDPMFNDFVDLNSAKATPAIESAQEAQKLMLQATQEQSNPSIAQTQDNGPIMKIGGLSSS